MDAMILAAGLGTRLREHTQDTPKALVQVGGVAVLEHVARRLVAAGADRLIINLHHHAERIIEHVQQRAGFGVDVVFSHETDAPLETGGGLRHAAALFRADLPFFLHNVDVLCDADLRRMYAAHLGGDALATLAVQQRQSSRQLLFDERGLCGRVDARADPPHTDPRAAATHGPRPAADAAVLRVAFAGIHVISPTLLALLTERGAFSIIDAYLRLAAAGHRIRQYDIGDAVWLEIGTPERLAAARRALG
jgi:NDP-sugar pyrophosphorylase family protein